MVHQLLEQDTARLLFVLFGAALNQSLPAPQVLVDVNWRPVFWEGQENAPERIREYVDKADIIKLSEEEAEFVYGVSCNDALYDPIQVCRLGSHTKHAAQRLPLT